MNACQFTREREVWSMIVLGLADLHVAASDGVPACARTYLPLAKRED